MSKFDKASAVEQVVWYCKIMDLPRSQNRALIDQLFNGEPPFTDEQARQNRIVTNVSDLSATKIASDARRQYSHAFFSTGNYFNVRVDRGPAWKRQEYGERITTEINRILKRSHAYSECLKSNFAQLVLHGCGPSVWNNRESWCPEMQNMGDIMIPTKTLRSMTNLQHFAVYRRYTAEQLWKLTHGPAVDPGWNVDLAERIIKWLAMQVNQQNSAFDLTYSPERIVEDFKESVGLYASDQVATCKAWDFYFWDDEAGKEGWKRRIILDTNDTTNIDGNTKNFMGERDQFLFDSGDRNYGDSWKNIAHFMFADCSAVAPFRYHSVRSLGFLLYAVCHVQNRLRCKFLDATFESLINYFRNVSPGDEGKVAAIDLINFGVIPNGIDFVKAQERWQVNPTLVEAALAMNRQIQSDNSSSFTQDFDYGKQNKELTATEVMAQVHSTSSMVGAMLSEAYDYMEEQYREIARRFCLQGSEDPDVKRFKVNCLKNGVPEELLDSDCWDIAAERVMGGGNAQLEVAEANMLMSQYNRLDPDGQRLAMRKFVFAVTQDSAVSDAMAPVSKPKVNEAVHDAQMAVGTLMEGIVPDMKPGINHIDYVETLLKVLATKIEAINQQGGQTSPQELQGLQTIGQCIQQHIAVIAQDDEESQRVKMYGDMLGKLMNEVKAFGQRLQEQAAQAAQGGNGGLDPQTQAKIAGTVILANTKAKIKEAEAEQKLRHSQERQDIANANAIRTAQVQTAATDLKTAADIRREGARDAAGEAESAPAKTE